MSAAALVSLVFSVITNLSVRTLSRVNVVSGIVKSRETQREVFGLYICTLCLVLVLSAGVVTINRGAEQLESLCLALIFAMLSGVSQFGDTCRVASRTDYVSSIFQLVSTVILTGATIYCRQWGVNVITIIYFGVPAVSQFLVLLQFWIQQKWVPRPVFHYGLISGQVVNVVPFLFIEISQYAKIYLSGAIVYLTSGAASYGEYTTLIFLAARLTNPISLVTRPMLPAFVDAKAKADIKWLTFVRRISMAFTSMALVITLGVFSNWGPWVLKWLLPAGAQPVSPFEAGALGLFLWGHALSALFGPVFFASRSGTEFYSIINALFVSLCLGCGAIAALRYGGQGMLVSMALGSTGVLLTAIARAAHVELNVVGHSVG